MVSLDTFGKEDKFSRCDETRELGIGRNMQVRFEGDVLLRVSLALCGGGETDQEHGCCNVYLGLGAKDRHDVAG